jgi:DNA polymerase-3 subunit delta
LIARNRERALKTLYQILDDGAEPVMLIGLIANNFHRLALAKELMSRGASEQEVFRMVGPMFGNRRQDFLATARRTDASTIARRIRKIADADLAIKTSKGTPRLQLEMLVCDLAR